MTQATPQVSFDNVTYSYDGEENVIQNVTVDFDQGSYIVVLGHNGSGKSTFAKHINTLLVPDSGSVKVFSIDTEDEDRWMEIRRQVGMVFQNPDDQMVTSVVRDDVAFGPENLGIPQPEIVERVEKSLKAVAMTPFAEADPTELSGGQKQRIAIAGVLAMEPTILVLDEPGAMLDPRGRAGLRRVMRRLNNQGITIIHITHFMEEALEADRVLVMDQGKIVLDETPEGVFSHGEYLLNLGLELPFTQRLATQLQKRGLDVPNTCNAEVLLEALCQ